MDGFRYWSGCEGILYSNSPEQNDFLEWTDGGLTEKEIPYLEGTYSELYPLVSQNVEGMQRLFKQFSSPSGSRAMRLQKPLSPFPRVENWVCPLACLSSRRFQCFTRLCFEETSRWSWPSKWQGESWKNHGGCGTGVCSGSTDFFVPPRCLMECCLGDQGVTKIHHTRCTDMG